MNIEYVLRYELSDNLLVIDNLCFGLFPFLCFSICSFLFIY